MPQLIANTLIIMWLKRNVAVMNSQLLTAFLNKMNAPQIRITENQHTSYFHLHLCHRSIVEVLLNNLSPIYLITISTMSFNFETSTKFF